MKITKYRPSDRPGALVPHFSIAYQTSWGYRYDNELQLFQKNGHRWIQFASRKYQNEAGETKYYSLSGFEMRQDHASFEKAILSCLDAFCANGANVNGQIFESKNQTQPPIQYKEEELPF